MALPDDELRDLLRATESDRVERKESFDPDRASQAVCAFANDLAGHGLPGVLFIGADDASGLPVGLEVSDGLQQKLAQLRTNGRILPPPQMSVRALDVGKGQVAVVEVEPSLTPPVRFKGVVWVRVGPTRAIATADEERRLSERRRYTDLPFDARPLRGVGLEALDLDLFRRTYLPSAVDADVLAENGRSEAEQLASLGLANLEAEPTACGLLVLGRSPTEHIPGAYLQFLRLAGKELDDQVRDDKVLDGPLVDVLRQLDEVLQLNISTSVDVTTTPEGRRPDYPLAALQQLTRNALMHRSYEATSAPVRVTWYEDRVEIWSPGGAFGVVNAENFGRHGVTDYRNPVLPGALRSLGYVQRFGVGLATAARTCRTNGNPEPRYVVEREYVAVTVGVSR